MTRVQFQRFSPLSSRQDKVSWRRSCWEWRRSCIPIPQARRRVTFRRFRVRDLGAENRAVTWCLSQMTPMWIYNLAEAPWPLDRWARKERLAMCVEHTCNFSMGNEFKVTLGYTARLYFKRKKGRSHVERKADFFFCMPLKLLKLFNSNAVTAVLEKV